MRGTINVRMTTEQASLLVSILRDNVDYIKDNSANEHTEDWLGTLNNAALLLNHIEPQVDQQMSETATKLNEIRDEYIAESMHSLTVPEIVGNAFEGKLSNGELECIMHAVITDFVLYVTNK